MIPSYKHGDLTAALFCLISMGCHLELGVGCKHGKHGQLLILAHVSVKVIQTMYCSTFTTLVIYRGIGIMYF